jgi:hypothetical protein
MEKCDKLERLSITDSSKIRNGQDLSTTTSFTPASHIDFRIGEKCVNDKRASLLYHEVCYLSKKFYNSDQ